MLTKHAAEGRPRQPDAPQAEGVFRSRPSPQRAAAGAARSLRREVRARMTDVTPTADEPTPDESTPEVVEAPIAEEPVAEPAVAEEPVAARRTHPHIL